MKTTIMHADTFCDIVLNDFSYIHMVLWIHDIMCHELHMILYAVLYGQDIFVHGNINGTSIQDK